MQEVRIKIHSITDLITNSSTVIYTYSDASLGACREMVDEVLKVLGSDKTCDDIFTLSISTDYDAAYISERDAPRGTPDEFIDEDGNLVYDKIRDLLSQIRSGSMSSPRWLDTAFERYRDSCDYPPETTLVVTPKEDQYQRLANLVGKFLYSTGHEASRNG